MKPSRRNVLQLGAAAAVNAALPTPAAPDVYRMRVWTKADGPQYWAHAARHQAAFTAMAYAMLTLVQKEHYRALGEPVITFEPITLPDRP